MLSTSPQQLKFLKELYSETWITQTAGDYQKEFELCVILPFSFDQTYELCSPFALTRVMSYALPLL